MLRKGLYPNIVQMVTFQIEKNQRILKHMAQKLLNDHLLMTNELFTENIRSNKIITIHSKVDTLINYKQSFSLN